MDKEKTLRKLKQEIEEVRKKYGIEFAEIVRCKDCKHYMTVHCSCDGCCISGDWYSHGDWHCADGERRDNDEGLRIST